MPPYVGTYPDVFAVALPTPSGPLAALRADPEPPAGAPVLLVPGFTGSKEDFVAVLPAIAAAGHPALTYDQRGQFESTGPEDPACYTVPALAADLVAVAEQLLESAPRARVHLLGHSFGGLVARHAVIERPELFGSLVLLGSGPAGIPGQRAVWLRRLRPILDRGGVPALWEASSALSAGDPAVAARPPEVQAFLRKRFLANNGTGLKVMGEALLNTPDEVQRLRETGVPVLVAHGEHDDAWPVDVQASMARRLGASYVAVPDALHSPAAEAPESTAKVLLDFWQSLPADGVRG